MEKMQEIQQLLILTKGNSHQAAKAVFQQEAVIERMAEIVRSFESETQKIKEEAKNGSKKA